MFKKIWVKWFHTFFFLCGYGKVLDYTCGSCLISLDGSGVKFSICPTWTGSCLSLTWSPKTISMTARYSCPGRVLHNDTTQSLFLINLKVQYRLNRCPDLPLTFTPFASLSQIIRNLILASGSLGLLYIDLDASSHLLTPEFIWVSGLMSTLQTGFLLSPV